ncbi:Mov34/MPN/PAD-1 family protein [Runella limosa]|uniref:Mov34/MPN/PAD-1 family protein n=1 Tax=Runella limosa TaxID=370978 RepID=UPI0006885ABB|nr:Mov34/MPN/PAD-1 family protein [Runella limosa]
MMIFKSKDGRFAVEVSQSIQKNIESYSAISGKNETGGILIGNYKWNQTLAVISEITGPPSDSKMGLTWFKRGIRGLKQLIERSWIKGHYYIGEWHFHPYASPNPSRQDIQEMKNIATSKIYNCPEPILLIIGGCVDNFKLRVFVSLGKNQLIELYS